MSHLRSAPANSLPIITTKAEEHGFREDKWMRTEQASRYKTIVTMLRAQFRSGERVLAGYPTITDWLWAAGVRNREGHRVDQQTIRRWRRDLNLPMLRGHGMVPGRVKASAPWTTSYALTAWLLSLPHSGGPRMPRIVARRNRRVANRSRSRGR
jgi:hypothetical protein